MMKTQIVETVTAHDMSALRHRRDAVTEADIVELRLDGVRDLDVAGALRDRRRPVVATCRPVWEGGSFDGAEETRRRVIEDAVALGAEYVDVERRAEWRPDRRRSNTRLIVSDHDFSQVPSDIVDRVAAIRAESPDMMKVSAMVQSGADCLALRDACRNDLATVVIGMGAFGRITRVLPGQFGSCWTYAGTAAPGQYSAQVLAQLFRVRHVTGATRLFAVTGLPLDHSASPAMHNAAFQALGLDAVYVPLQAVSVEDAQALADALGVCGMSVTAPYKREWQVTLDDDASRALGAVNTLKRSGKTWLGRNVDGDGFLDAFMSRGFDLAGKRVVILGAGGAARAVGLALVGRGCRVDVSARRPAEATRLATTLGAGSVTWPPVGEWDVLVNTTPVGTWPDVTASPVPASGATADVVYDLVYNPAETALMRRARTAGAQVIGGLDMLVGQAIRQQMWWTGETPSPVVMAEAARSWISASAVRMDDETDNV